MKKNIFIIVIVMLFFVSVFICLSLGTVKIPFSEVIKIILLKSKNETFNTIVLNIRLPRILTALLVGAGLSVSGLILQTLLRNPLAEPYILGISSGSALGICLGVLLKKTLMLPLFAATGGSISTLLIYLIAIKKNFSNTSLILSGILLNFIFSSTVVMFLIFLNPEDMRTVLYWFMGSLQNTNTDLLKLCFLIMFICILILSFLTAKFDALILEEDKAFSLGVDVKKIKKISFFITAVITGCCVSLCGIIGFIGLIVPHFARILFGFEHRKLFFITIFLGATFLCWADTLARTLFAFELPAGGITGIIGGIIFLYLLITKTNKEIM